MDLELKGLYKNPHCMEKLTVSLGIFIQRGIETIMSNTDFFGNHLIELIFRVVDELKM